jgi:serine protease AprX
MPGIVGTIRMRFRLLLTLFFACWATTGLQAQLPLPTPPPPVAPLLPLPPPPVPDLGKLDTLLRSALDFPTLRSRVIVRATGPEWLDALAPLIAQAGGTLGHRLALIDAQAAVVPNVALPGLTTVPFVARIVSDRLAVATLERTGATIGAVEVRRRFGYDGTGVGVAVIDSGVSPWHDDLGDGAGRQRIDQFVDLINGRAAAYDDFGHGTHVAGIIAGNGFDSGGARAGIAPGARLLVVKALGADGRGRISDVIAAFASVIAAKEQFGIRIVNVSIGAAVYESYDTDLLTVAAKVVVDSGLILVASAGNNGRRDGETIYGGVTAPGNAPWVLTAGAFSHGGTARRDDDSIAPFSSRGPTTVDYAAKPDIVAPGVGIESLSDPVSRLYMTRSSALLPGTVATPYLPYLSLSGTSQATPVVTGTIALMLQANPALTANAVKAVLQYTAYRYGYDALTEGAGFLNTLGAVELARFFASPTAATYPVAKQWSRHLVWGNRRITGGVLTPDANAWSPDVTWGDATRAAGPIVWGLKPTGSGSGAWGTRCADAACTTTSWDAGTQNVVWGSQCGGDDCAAPPSSWSAGDAPIWSSQDQDTIVWGTDDHDTIVWGTNDHDTIVWGTTDQETIVWGTSCDDPDCVP